MFETGPVTGSIDNLEQDFVRLTAAMSRLDALRLQVLRQLDVAQVASADGARSMVEWVAGRFDLETGTARTLIDLARAADVDIEELLESGLVTTDRAAAVVGLKTAGADHATVDRSWSHDLSGVRRLTGQHRQLSSSDESDSFASRYLHTQPSLDETFWKFWGQLTGVDGQIVDKALRTAIDSLPNNPDTTPSQDRADALVTVASEWLTGDAGGHNLTAEIFIDGNLATVATVTDGQAGATVVSGPRVGPNTLHEILCAGTVQINFADEYGQVSTSPTNRAIPAPIRSRVLHRDGHRCVIAGCNSRTRLQPTIWSPTPRAGPITRTIWSPCAGITIMSSSTSKADGSTLTRPPNAAPSFGNATPPVPDPEPQTVRSDHPIRQHHTPPGPARA